MAHGPSRSATCGIFPDRDTNPCPLHRQLTETGFEESTGSLTNVLGLEVSVISGMEEWKWQWVSCFLVSWLQFPDLLTVHSTLALETPGVLNWLYTRIIEKILLLRTIPPESLGVGPRHQDL